MVKRRIQKSKICSKKVAEQKTWQSFLRVVKEDWTLVKVRKMEGVGYH